MYVNKMCCKQKIRIREIPKFQRKNKDAPKIRLKQNINTVFLAFSLLQTKKKEKERIMT